VNEEYERLCLLGNSAGTCPPGNTCGSGLEYDMDPWFEEVERVKYMNYGVVNFDNIFAATLSVFQSLTRQGWSQIMYNVNLKNPLLS